MRSLERRFVIGLGAILLLVFGFLFWGSATAVRSVAEAQLLTRLEHDAEALVAAFGPSPRGQMRLREGKITPIFQQPLSGHYFAFLLDDGKQIRSRSLWDEGLPLDILDPGTVQVQRMPGPGDQRLLARLAGYEKAGRRFTLLVAEDLAPLTQQIARFEWIVAGLLGLALLLVLLVQRYVLRRGFAELDRVRAEIRQVFSGERHRIEELGPSEVRPLSTEVNRLLDQLLKRLQRSRQSLGNLAHALKAPLSLLTRDVETLGLADADHQRLSTRLTQIGELVDRELRRARIAGEGAGRHFVPSRDVPDLLEAVRQLHHERGIEIVAGSLPDATLSFDYDDMIELLGNLLDNACKWATGRVELDVEVADSLAFTVADDGPGVAEDRRDELLQRGGRLDEQAAGHGLGLAIVNDLVDDYGGRLELGRSAALGGLEARVSLPRRQDAVA